MPANGVDSRPSTPPRSPPPQQQQPARSSASGSSGAQSPQLARRLNTDSFGAANNNDLQSTRSATSPRAGSALADRFQDGFQAGNASSRNQARLQLLQGGAQPQSARPQGRGQPQPLGTQRPNPQPDPATRARVEADLARRLQGGGDARDIADRMARRLGNGDMQRGMAALDRALQRGRLNVGLAGINGLLGGRRSPQELDALTRDMRNVPGGNVDAVLDNANGGGEASRGESNARQLAALTELAGLARQLNLPMDVTSHSNGFNTLRQLLSENPDARLGNVTLVNPNIPPNYQDTQRAFRDMVGRSDNVRLLTTFSDEAVPWSGAGSNGQGPVWQQQINAAAEAGVQDITVLTNAHHSVESVGQHINRPGRLNLDLRWDPEQGRTVPVDPDAWRGTGYQWTENGLQQVPPRRRIAG